MRIACLQFAPRVGEVEANIKQADRLLEEAGDEMQGLDLLVLPEMAFSGYNFPSLTSILPYLEPTSCGPSTQWAIRTAKKLNCVVNVGYPEECTTFADAEKVATTTTTTNYNTVVSVCPDGSIGAMTRKHFLYYTDETWASEGPEGFWSGELFSPIVSSPLPSTSTSTSASTSTIATDASTPPTRTTSLPQKVAMGICMDINPQHFTAPWTSYEFATHCVTSSSSLIVLSMAWLTRLDPSVLVDEEERLRPDGETVAYWVQRFVPVVKASVRSSSSSSSSSSLSSAIGSQSDRRVDADGGYEEREEGASVTGQAGRETLIVMANRCGTEPGTLQGVSQGVDPVTGEDVVSYAGSSCVMRVRDGEVQIYDLMGKGEEGVLVVDTDEEPKYAIRARLAKDDGEDV